MCNYPVLTLMKLFNYDCRAIEESCTDNQGEMSKYLEENSMDSVESQSSIASSSTFNWRQGEFLHPLLIQWNLHEMGFLLSPFIRFIALIKHRIFLWRTIHHTRFWWIVGATFSKYYYYIYIFIICIYCLIINKNNLKIQAYWDRKKFINFILFFQRDF